MDRERDRHTYIACGQKNDPVTCTSLPWAAHSAAAATAAPAALPLQSAARPRAATCAAPS